MNEIRYQCEIYARFQLIGVFARVFEYFVRFVTSDFPPIGKAHEDLRVTL